MDLMAVSSFPYLERRPSGRNDPTNPPKCSSAAPGPCQLPSAACSAVLVETSPGSLVVRCSPGPIPRPSIAAAGVLALRRGARGRASCSCLPPGRPETAPGGRRPGQNASRGFTVETRPAQRAPRAASRPASRKRPEVSCRVQPPRRMLLTQSDIVSRLSGSSRPECGRTPGAEPGRGVCGTRRVSSRGAVGAQCSRLAGRRSWFAPHCTGPARRRT